MQIALGLEHQTATFAHQGLCLHQARMGQRAGEHADGAALEPPQVDDLVAAVLHLEADIVEIAPGDLDHLSGGQHDVAALRLDHRIAVGSHIGRDQVHIAIARTDAALHLDVTGHTVTRKLEFSCLEVLVVQRQRGGDKTLRVDDAARTEHDTIGIDQEHLAVGAERAVDPALQRRVLALHPVEHRAGRALLLEEGGFAGADRELLPVDDGTRRVRDRQLAALGLHRGLAMHDDGATGIGLDQLRRHAVDCRQRDDQRTLPADGLQNA